MLIVWVRFSVFYKITFLILMLGICFIPEGRSQVIVSGETADTSFHYDEINVLVVVEGYGDFYSDVIYTDNNLLYVNIEELFKTLRIPCIVGQKGDSIGGFLRFENQTYIIDYKTKIISIGGKTIKANNGLIKAMGSVFMESSLFGKTFGLILTFNFRALTIVLKSNFELPIIKQLREEKIRNNISKIKQEIIPDTIVGRNYHLFKAGMLDWAFSSTQTLNGFSNSRFKLGVGAELLYGEADFSFDYYNQQKIDPRQLQYLWRWVDNDKRIIKQAQVGTIPYQTISFINSQIVGAVVRNSSTLVRKAKGYYTINEHTEPNWTVELYINNVLVEYTKADASGLYVFKVPIVYGYTTLKFKFYGPMGEERTEERTINVPYTVLPAKEFEYGLTAGFVQDSNLSRFGKAEINYGVTRFLTIGGGLEYLSSIPNGAYIPYIKGTIQPFSKLTINGEYAYGVKTNGLVNYSFMKNASLEIEYTKYVPGQLAIPFRYLEERKAKISMPFIFRKISGYAKLDYTQLVYNDFYYNQGNITFSIYYKQFSTNSSTQLNWIDQKTPYISSDLALSYRIRNGYIFSTSAQYNVSDGQLITLSAEIEKRISKGYLSASFERNLLFNANTVTLNFKFDFQFARTNVAVSYNNDMFTASESAQGSLAFGGGQGYTQVSNNLSVTKGGIALYPFLDLNNNGTFDQGEHMVKLTAVRIMGGTVLFNKKDSIVRISNLNAFINYFVTFDDADLENIAWRFKNKLYQILVDPNQYKRVDVPIIIVGEVSGMVYVNKENVLKGLGRIVVKFYKKNSNVVVAETQSESDGYIDFMGLAPGDYVARIDAGQMKNLSFRAEPPEKEFTIKISEQGDIVEGIDFVLNPQ